MHTMSTRTDAQRSDTDSFLNNAKEKATGVGSAISNFFLDLDEKYAAALRSGQPDMGANREAFEATSIRDLMNNPAEMTNKDGDSFFNYVVNPAMQAAPYASNIAVRYGLPAAGVTLAGKGLYDLTVAFGGGADYQEQGQLPLG